MTTPIKFHLDEHIHSAIAAGLRGQGIDISTTAEAGLIGANDTEHLTFANGAGRVIITHDNDYLRLHADGNVHAGIAYCHQDKYSIGELLNMLIFLQSCYTSEEMHGRVEYL